MARPRTDRWATAVDHLCRTDQRWRPIVDRAGPCQLRPTRDRFGTLVRSIVSQQISGHAARTIEARLRLAAGDPHTPEGLLAASDEALRGAGLSRVKALYIRDLAAHVADGRIDLKRIGRLTDEQIIARLTQVKGIGRWTAEMFLVFALNRPDILSVHDLGIRNGLRLFHGLPALPSPRACDPLAELWRPHRSVAMWYLWRLPGLELAQARAVNPIVPD